VDPIEGLRALCVKFCVQNPEHVVFSALFQVKVRGSSIDHLRYQSYREHEHASTNVVGPYTRPAKPAEWGLVWPAGLEEGAHI